MTAPEPTGTPNGGDESFTRLAAPVFAGFSVPTIVLLASSTVPNQPWHDLALTLMILASGLFLAGFQLSIGKLYNDHRDSWGKFRAGLTFAGIALVIAALVVLVAAVNSHWWVDLALAVFAVVAITPMVVRAWASYHPTEELHSADPSVHN